MYQLLPAKFRFGLFLVEQSKFIISSQSDQPTICYADTYEIKDDGSIIFYQTGISVTENKRVKIPVIAYPKGKWEVCILIDSNNKYPVFQNDNNTAEPIISPKEVQLKEHNQVNSVPESTNNLASELKHKNDDLDLLNDLFVEESVVSESSTTVTQNIQAPNISLSSNQVDLKKMRNEFLEVQIKDYVKNNTHFYLNEFETFISKNNQFETLKITEIDIIWTASNLIRDKLVLARKFSDPMIQKTLALILPDIMRRQWSGKIGPIIQILIDREETKYVNAIDLAVWMIQTGFE